MQFGAEVLATECAVRLLGAAEQLQENAFLDVGVLVDRRSDGSSQSIVHIGLLGQRAQKFDAFRRENVILAVNRVNAENRK